MSSEENMSELAARCFPNDLPDYSGGFEHNNGGELQADAFLAAVRPFLRNLISGITQHLSFADADESVYTGGPGVAFLFLRLSKAGACLGPGGPSSEECLAHASTLLRPRQYDPSISPSLLCGQAGHICMRALYHHLSGRSDKAYQRVKQYTALYQSAVQDESDEWLYGRAGFVHGLLLLKEVVLRATSTSGERAAALRKSVDEAIHSVCRRMIESGRAYDHRGIPAEHQCPLMYQWYGEEYLGAAHGVLGILAQIMAARTVTMEEALGTRQGQGGREEKEEGGGKEKEQREREEEEREREEEEDAVLIKAALSWCQAQRSELTNNLPAVAFEPPGPAVHFCHGAPGAVLSYGIAHRWLSLKQCGAGPGPALPVAEPDSFLQEALRAGECVWKYGLLRKGPGLCHGIGGNGQCLLALYQHSRDPKWLWRAAQFALKIIQLSGDPLRLDGPFTGKPDNSLSLFEGLAGTACFLLDLLRQLAAVQMQCHSQAALFGSGSSCSLAGGVPGPGPARSVQVVPVAPAPAFPLFEVGGF